MRVMIIDDHPVVRKGIRSILEAEGDITVGGEAEEAERGLELILELKPDIAIVDIELKGSENGLQLIKKIKSAASQVVSLVMSMDDGSLYAERSIKAGAKGYVAKEEASDNIVNAIRKVATGELYLSEKLMQRIASSKMTPHENFVVSVEILSNKEFEIFTLIGQGYKRSEISRKMNMNINTIESHRRKIREKFALSSSAELSRIAVKWYATQNK